MKKLYKFVFLFAAGFALFSCKKGDFLGQTQTTDLTEQAVFSDSTKTIAFLSNIYSKIGFSEDSKRFTNGGLDIASDEAEPYDNSATTPIAFANGSVDANTVSDDAYNTCYTQIRSVNVFMKNLPKAPLKQLTKTQVLAEARFLRAWYYSILLKHYGGVVLVGDTVYNYNDKVSAKRASFDECVNYIVSECDEAAKILPPVQTALTYGRASGGACKALKMRVLLYSASPLFNPENTSVEMPYNMAGGNQELKKLLGHVTPSQLRWDTAAAAAKAVMDQGTYKLEENNASPGYGFQYVFTQRYNNEYIFQVMKGNNNDLESLYLPPSRGGKGGGFPYQEFVDAFQMANGKDITDPASGYDPNKPYDGRDPRLAYSVLRDQSTWITNSSLTQTPINIYTVNGQGVGLDAIYSGTKTGYYGAKMLDPAAVPNSFNSTTRCIPLIRYAEVLLSYAEAINESQGPAQAYAPIEAIRKRAGLVPFALPTGLNKDQMRKVIQHERRIELAFEGHRFWDVRRWLLGDTQNAQFTGMEIQRDGAGNLKAYKRVNVRKHGFKGALYLWPLPAAEVAKSKETLQNPGY
ncbi:RagB/SusD family nutrient uptake outer membrane protein [Mucilaginibacter conchicola]|uniref:RagB/SusD family nutrient uptake outer membrane protein n=1 Tax=Mucilaginibacter conchicola TaxID=2303333 RepID=A0A372NYD3_9SPHI|nr:RagB/SusD family nutrient uptake outer membrane protein [Mucilaginibacter conchicola]RFZ94901.1 RagB/SusD family nutrient uptake outer membrane protein [Mucilaginibacter conchicola]